MKGLIIRGGEREIEIEIERARARARTRASERERERERARRTSSESSQFSSRLLFSIKSSRKSTLECSVNERVMSRKREQNFGFFFHVYDSDR